MAPFLSGDVIRYKDSGEVFIIEERLGRGYYKAYKFGDPFPAYPSPEFIVASRETAEVDLFLTVARKARKDYFLDELHKYKPGIDSV